jgi:D-alanyl-D-alanine carboxypeptidase
MAGNAGASGSGGDPAITFFTAGLQPPMTKPSELLAGPAAYSEPIPVYTGPTRTGAALLAAVAVDAEKQTPRHRGKKSRVASQKPNSAAEPKAEANNAGKDAKSDTKPEPKSAAKPAAVRHANAKPDDAPKAAEKPAAAKPAKPKAVAKPSTKPKNTSSEAKPAHQIAAAPRT